MKRDSRYPWFLFDIVLFAAINIGLLFIVRKNGLYIQFSVFELVILALAAYRLADIVSNEAVTKSVRAPFVTEVNDHGKHIEQPIHSGLRGSIGTLLYCPSCTGVWFSMVFVYSFIFWPSPTFIVAVLFALSAIERIIFHSVSILKKRHMD